jgi:hypothetical protein
MTTILVSKSQLFGLCAYVNQAELSLDRIEPNARHTLPEFYKNQVRHPVQFVLAALRKLIKDSRAISTIDWNRFEKTSRPWASMIAGMISSLLFWHHAKGIRLPAVDVVHVADALEQFERVLARPESFDQDELTIIRLRLAMASNVLSRRLPSRALASRARAVVHLNHSEFLQLKGVEEIAGTDWLTAE